MPREFTVEQAAEVIASAFAPLRCVAEPWDYGYRVRFRVYDDADGVVIEVAELLKPQVTDARRLESVINQARLHVEDRGFTLDPWTFPGSTADVEDPLDADNEAPLA